MCKYIRDVGETPTRVFACAIVPPTVEQGKSTMGQLAKGVMHAAMVLLVTAAGTAMAAVPPIKIGVQAPMSGKYALEGLGIARAVKLLAKQRNDAGGLLGRRVEVIVCDDQDYPPQAAICARKMVMAGVTAVVGTYSGDATLVAGPIYAAADIIQTSGNSNNVLGTKGWNTFFRNAPSTAAEAGFIANYLVKVRHFHRIALLSDYSRHSTGLAQSVAKEVTARQGDIVASTSITRGTRDFGRVLSAIKPAKPDAVFYAGPFAEGALIRAQMVLLGMRTAFIGSDSNMNPGFTNLAGKSSQGAIIVSDFPAPDDMPWHATRKFLDDYTQMYGSAPPGIHALTNADGLRAVFAAIEATRSTDPSRLIPWLHNLKKPFDGITGPFTWDQHGERIGSPIAAFEIQANGSYKKVYPQG